MTRGLRGMSYADGAASLRPLEQPNAMPIQRKSDGSASEGMAAPATSGGGAPLDSATRGSMEKSFGTDFGNVRVHQGDQAKAVGAKAYTQGSDIHFAAGQYDPKSTSGKELIGHELTHVVQQRARRVVTPQTKRAGQPAAAPIQSDAGLEREADVAGAKAARGEAAGIGSQASASTSSNAPIQRKTDERMAAKAGTYEHAQEAQAMLRGDEGPRFEQVVAALRDKKGGLRKDKGTGPFHQLSLALAGNPLDAQKYGAAVLKVSRDAPDPFVLKDDIKTAFGPGVAHDYLVSMLDTGEPTFPLRMAVLAGMGPDGKVPKALRGAMESASADEVRQVDASVAVIQNGVSIKSTVREVMGVDRYDALLELHGAASPVAPPAPAPVPAAPAPGGAPGAQAAAPGAQPAPAPAPAQAAAPVVAPAVDRTAVSRARDKQLLAILKQHTIGRNVNAEHVLDEVKSLLPAMKKDERDFLATGAGPGGVTSAFHAALKSAAASAFALTTKNFQLIIDTLKTGHIAGAIEPDDEDNKGEVEKADKANEVSAGLKHLKRGTTDNNSAKTQIMRGVFGRGEAERAELKAKVDGMSDMERREFLASKATNRAHAVKLRDPTVPMTDCADAVEHAWVQFASELMNAKFRDREIATIKARFKSGSMAGTHYLALVDLANSPKVVFGSFIERTIDLLRQLGPGETAQLVKDAALVKKLYTRANNDKKWRADIEPLIGVIVSNTGDVPDDKLATIKQTLKGAEADQATDEAFDLNPKRLGKLIDLAVHSVTTNKAKVIGLAQQVQFAAARWDLLGRQGGDKQSRLKLGNLGATRLDFIQAVYASINDDTKKKWLADELPKVHKLLTGALPPGVSITVDDRLDAAASHHLVTHADKAQITASFEDLPPAELLKEWSDFPDHKRQVLDVLPNLPQQDPRREALETRKKNYVIGIAPERYKYLNKQLDRAQVVENEKKLLAKLRAAAESDTAVQRALADAGVQNDDLARELMTTTGTLSEHSMRASGYQNTLGSGKSGAMREARTAMVGEARKAEAAQAAPGADKEAARKDGAEAIKDKRKSYEERAKSFEKMKAKVEAGILLAVEALAYLAVTAATAGAGAVAAGAMEILIKSIVIAVKATSSVLVKSAMRGDGYSWKDSMVELAVAGAEIGGEWTKFAIDAAIASLLTKNNLGPPGEGEADGRAMYKIVGADIVTAIGKSSGGVIQEIAKSGTEQLASEGTHGADRDMGRKVRNLARVGAVGMVAEPIKDKLGGAVRPAMEAHSNDTLSHSVVAFATPEYATNPRVDQAVNLAVSPESAKTIDKAPERSSLSVQLDIRLNQDWATFAGIQAEGSQVVADANTTRADVAKAETELFPEKAKVEGYEARATAVAGKVDTLKAKLEAIDNESGTDPQAEATGAKAKARVTEVVAAQVSENAKTAVDQAEAARAQAVAASEAALTARLAALTEASVAAKLEALKAAARADGVAPIDPALAKAARVEVDAKTQALSAVGADAKKTQGPESALAKTADKQSKAIAAAMARVDIEVKGRDLFIENQRARKQDAQRLYGPSVPAVPAGASKEQVAPAAVAGAEPKVPVAPVAPVAPQWPAATKKGDAK